MKVMQFVPALNQGGAEKSTLEIADALVKAGHEAVVVSAGGRMVADLLTLGARHVELDLQKKSPRTLMQIFAVRRLLRLEQPDIVHLRSRLPAWMVHWARAGLRGALSTSPAHSKPRVVSTIHGLNSPSFYSAILTRADHIICVSETARNHILQHYPSCTETPCSVIARGIDHHRFRFHFQPSGVWRAGFVGEFPGLAGKKLFVLPGRGTRLKGHADALHALARVRERNVDAALLLLGVIEPGRERYVRELRELSTTLKLSAHVVMTTPRDDVREVFASATAILQTSRTPESFGRTVVEALALGVPVIGYDHGGVGEILTHHFSQGRVALGDVDSLAERMAVFANIPPAMQPMRSFHLQTMQESTLAVYQSLLT